ncbi:hypothetical protein BDC45DRAFT_570413 [Circinella umbellata]|nr:hypothetical protein BDC45DRAFT_570413 [Circinella umbellata]
MMITTISDAVSATTLTHNGSLTINDFERRCVGLNTCIRIRSNKLTPEVDYQGRRPYNVCQRCFCLNRVCYNFRPVVVDGKLMDGNWCDQCRLNKRSGCSNLTYHDSGSGQVPILMPGCWLVQLMFQSWYFLLDIFSNQVPSGSLVRRSRRLAGNVALAAYNEVEEENDELETESESDNNDNNNEDKEYPFASDESDYQWNATPVSHGTIDAMRTPDPQLFLESVIPSPLVSPPLRPSDQDSVSSPSLPSSSSSDDNDSNNRDYDLVFYGGPAIQSGGRHFSAPNARIDLSDKLRIDPRFFAGNAQSWYGDGLQGQEPSLNLSPPPISPISLPDGPTLNQDQRRVAELEALNPLRPLFALPTLGPGGRYIVHVRGGNNFFFEFLE